MLYGVAIADGEKNGNRNFVAMLMRFKCCDNAYNTRYQTSLVQQVVRGKSKWNTPLAPGLLNSRIISLPTFSIDINVS